MIRKLLLATLVLLTTGLLPAHAQVNYPMASTFVVKDQQGNVVTGTTKVHVGDHLRATGSGWKAKSPVHLEFFSSAIDLGMFTTDAQGNLDAPWTVPDVPLGMHTLRATGTGSDGQSRVNEASIQVVAAASATTTTTIKAGTAGSGSGVAGSGSGGGSTQVLGSTVTNTSPFALTGANIGRLLAIAFTLIAAGAAIFFATRQRRRFDY